MRRRNNFQRRKVLRIVRWGLESAELPLRNAEGEEEVVVVMSLVSLWC